MNLTIQNNVAYWTYLHFNSFYLKVVTSQSKFFRSQKIYLEMSVVRDDWSQKIYFETSVVWDDWSQKIYFETSVVWDDWSQKIYFETSVVWDDWSQKIYFETSVVWDDWSQKILVPENLLGNINRLGRTLTLNIKN